jgi:hypothetical protein
MFRPLLFTILSFGVLFALSPSAASAQNNKNKNNANRNDERRENEAVQKAQKDVNAAEKLLREAEKSARQAVERLKGAERDQTKAASHLQKQRDELEAKHADLLGLTEARRTLDAARRAYEKAGEPILKAVAESARYKSAVEDAKTADRRLATVREDKEGDAPDRLKQMSELAKTKLVPKQMEREALDAESSLKSQRAEFKAAEDAVTRTHAAVEKAVEKDPAIKSAKDAFEKAKSDLVAARREAEKEARQMTDARQKLAREQQDLQQKINADRKDDNKPKNKNKR